MSQRKKGYRLVTALLAAVLLCTACGQGAAASVMQLVKLEGTVGVSDGEGRELSPEEKMMLYNGYRMETRNESFAWINLDSVKLAKMDEDSGIEIRRDGKQLEIFINTGNLYFNISEPLEDDEALDIRTSNMAVGIRGTCGWVEAMDASHMRVFILEGTVQCSVTDPESGETAAEAVSGGEMAELILNSGEDGSCEIRKESFTEYWVPGFVQNELLQDRELQDKVQQDSGLAIPEDGMEPQAYLDQADSYLQQEKQDYALEILRRGLEIFEDNEEIAAKIEELESGGTGNAEEGGNAGEDGGSEEGSEEEASQKPESKIFRYYSYYGENALRYYMEYTYDGQGRPVSVAVCGEDGTEIDRVEILHDEQGNLTQEGYVESGDGRMGRNVYEYDAQGRRISEANYSATGYLSYRIACTYDDAAGNLTRESRYDAQGASMGYDEYEYNADNQLIRKTHLDAGGTVSYYTAYEYDAQGNQTKESSFQPDGSPSSYYEYEYDGSGSRTKESYFNPDGTLATSTEYEYDGNGNMIRQVNHTFWGGTLYTLYEYDSDGNKIRSTEYDSEGNISGGAAWEYMPE